MSSTPSPPELNLPDDPLTARLRELSADVVEENHLRDIWSAVFSMTPAGHFEDERTRLMMCSKLCTMNPLTEPLLGIVKSLILFPVLVAGNTNRDVAVLIRSQNRVTPLVGTFGGFHSRLIQLTIDRLSMEDWI